MDLDAELLNIQIPKLQKDWMQIEEMKNKN